jgi:release factor glutamine methyltransferase
MKKQQEIYSPKEDSYLLAEQIIKHFQILTNEQLNKIKVLDIGSGSGMQAQTCLDFIDRKNILCADINPKAIKHLKSNNFKAKQSDLFSNINKKQKFDLITFNPPYLPTSEYDDQWDTTAGPNGNETIIKFLKKAKSFLEKDGSIILLFSNLSHPRTILSNAKKLNYKTKKLAEKNMGFFERLYVYELKP